MVEVVKNLQIEETAIPEKENNTLEETENLQDSSSDITYSEEVDLTGDKHETLNERSVEESQLPPSKWSSLTRAFRLGTAHDSPHSSNKDDVKALQHEMKSVDKRGSLGKIFRHGFHSEPRPNTAADHAKSAFDLTESSTESPQSTEKGMKWNFFKYGKSNQMSGGEERATSKDDTKRRPLSRILHIRSRTPKEQESKIFDALDGNSNEGQIPSPDSRRHSLGKLFRHN